MAQNVYDRDDFFAGYSQLPRSVHGLDGAPEWPAIRALIPPLSGKRVVDLGCGFGWFARWAREQGAAGVLALDLSENMLARARADTPDAAIEYKRADLEQLDLPPAGFDFAYSSLAFHYIEDFGKLLRTLHQALIPAADFVFTIEHPIYMAPEDPNWLQDAAGRRTWPVNGYALEGPRTTDWLAKGVRKYHRRLGTTVNALIGAGFAIQHLQEWAPDSVQVAATPALSDELDRPMMLLVHVRRA